MIREKISQISWLMFDRRSACREGNGCWSYADHAELWIRKHGITGFTVQLVSLLDGTPVYVSEPLPGNTHDKTELTKRRSLRSSASPAGE
jgi:hypothetical protein